MSYLPPHQTLSPFQAVQDREILRESFERVPASCDTISEVLDEVAEGLSKTFGILPEDHPLVDAIMRIAHSKIRDRVSHVFRDDQIKLLKEIHYGQ